MPDKDVKKEALNRMLEAARADQMPMAPAGDEMMGDRPDSVLCQVCGHMVDTMTGEDLGPAEDFIEADMEYDDGGQQD